MAGAITESVSGQGSSLSGAWPRAAASVLVLAGGLTLTALLWHDARQDEARRQQARLEFRVDRICAAIQARMSTYEQVLRGASSLVVSTGGVTRSRWHDYVAHLELDRGVPGIQGMGWVRYVPATGVAAFERGLRAEGLKSYAVRPAGERSGYGPVTYLEPSNDRNLRMHGFDMLSEPVRREAMERARDSGTAVLSAKLGLASEVGPSVLNDLLMYVPVYSRPARELQTPEQRRAALLGWVHSPLRIADLLRNVSGSYRDDLNLRLFDGATIAVSALMHDDGNVPGAKVLPGLPPLTRVLDLPGHAWTLEFTPLQGLADEEASPWPLRFFGLAGAGISVLLSALTWLLLARMAQSRREQVRLRHMALTDQLTNLPNRMLLQQRLSEAVAHCRQTHACGAVLFVDLDNFKFINDSDGHHAGDAVLEVQAQRLAAAVRTGDVVARLGGDEFCIVLGRVCGAEEAAQVAEEVIRVVSDPIEIHGRAAQVGASVGIAMIPPEGADIHTLLRHADTAMYRAKLGGKNRYHFFGAELEAAAVRRTAVERLVRKALQDGAFELHYQPVVDLADGHALGAEALLRLPQPGAAAAVPTGELVAVAEQCGLIGVLGAWVLDTACAQLGAWQAAGARRLRLAVNVSARQLHGRDFVEQLQQALARHRVEPARLELELTETALLTDQSQALRAMRELRAMGVSLVLDDFGTGYSSLSHLKDFPITKIKIDRRFVYAPDGGLADAGITQAIVALGRGLGLEVVAEGIETVMQAQALREQGCRIGQGWLFSKALPAAEFERRYGLRRSGAQPAADAPVPEAAHA